MNLHGERYVDTTCSRFTVHGSRFMSQRSMFWRFDQPDSNDRVKESRKNKAMDTVNILNNALNRLAPQIMLFFSPTTVFVISIFFPPTSF